MDSLSYETSQTAEPATTNPQSPKSTETPPATKRKRVHRGMRRGKTKPKKSKKLKLKKNEKTDKEGTEPAPEETADRPASSGGADELRDKLESSRFRYLNEQLYTKTGTEAAEMFREDSNAYAVYHKGYARQVGTFCEVAPFGNLLISRQRSGQ